MKSLSLMIQGLFICIVLSSCTPVPIIIPLFPEEPLQEKELQFLKPGETTLSEIKEHLWEPLATRNNGKLLLYREHNPTWVGWVGPGFMELKIVAFLVMEINEDNTLKRYEVLRNHEGFFSNKRTKDCTSWGFCLDIERLQFECLESLVDDATYIFWEHQVEQFELEHPPDGQCQIITYLDNKSKFGTLRVHIDENPTRAISKKGFLRNIVQPGNHTLTVDWPLCSEKSYKMWADSIRQSLSCNSGESLFVSVFDSKKVFRATRLNMKIESTDEGLKIVRERRLIID
ncbi:hypothetical protein ACFLYW_01360 [Thermodesulfobacteriota bacterium]